MSDRQLTTIAALVVLGLEVVTCLVGLYTGDYTALKIITPVMLILSGKVFAQDFFQRRDTKGGSNDDSAH